MAVTQKLESEILYHGWGAKGLSVDIVPADTRTCPRRHSGRTKDPNAPCNYGAGPGERLLVHPTIRLPEGRPIECPNCGWLAVIAYPEEERAAQRAAVADGRVVRIDVTRGIYTLGDLVEYLGKLFPALGLGPVHVELVGPDRATVPYEEPVEAAPPKSENELLQERVAALEAKLAESADRPRRRKAESEPDPA